MTVGATRARVVALVPAWKASAFIVATLEALAAQTYANLEILVSDDASPDGTAALCERFAAGDDRFRVIRQPHNLGWVGNVNALLREARGDYLVFAYHDDLPEPTFIERCVAELEADPRAILAFTDIAVVEQDGTREDDSYPLLDGVVDRLQRARLVARKQGSWWIPNRGVFRASAPTAIGGLRRHLGGEVGADWPWLLHMSLLGEFVRIPERLCTKVYQLGSLSRSRSWGSRYTLCHIAVALSALRAVSRAEIPVREKFVLQGILAASVWRRLWRRTLGRWLRRLRSRER